jgi:hypothetical protein
MTPTFILPRSIHKNIKDTDFINTGKKHHMPIFLKIIQFTRTMNLFILNIFYIYSYIFLYGRYNVLVNVRACIIAVFIVILKTAIYMIVLLLSTFITIWSRVLLEKLTVTQLVKFPAFHGTRSFITMFTKAPKWSLSLVRCIQFTSSRHI